MRIGVALLVLLASCGGQPAGAKVPAANPAKVAGVAAAAAAIVTIADPDAARQRQEDRGGERESKGKEVKETVPEGVLFADDATEQADDEKDKKPTQAPCKQVEAPLTQTKPRGSIDLFPPIDENRVETPERCKEEDDKPKTDDKRKTE